MPGGTELEELLCRAWETGRAPWPGVELTAGAFIRHLAMRLSKAPEGLPLAPLLEQLALDELYLACACMHGMPGAVEALERHYLAYLPTLLEHRRYTVPMLDDVCQLVRVHLLMGRGDARPKLAEYTGRGSLLKWIRVVAERIAIRQGISLREVPEENIAALVEEVPGGGDDVELDYFKRRFNRELRRALREAFAALSSEQQELVRLYFIEGLSTTELGLLLRLNQSTISRRLKGARRAIYEKAKRCLQERLGLSSRGLESHVKAMDSQVELSFGGLMPTRE